jgi:hypothetical protein
LTEEGSPESGYQYFAVYIAHSQTRIGLNLADLAVDTPQAAPEPNSHRYLTPVHWMSIHNWCHGSELRLAFEDNQPME